MSTLICQKNGVVGLLASALGLWLSSAGASEVYSVDHDVRNSQTVFYWQDLTLDLIKKYQLNPLRASRALAAMHLAAWESLGASGSLTECSVVAVDESASRLLDYLFPQETPGAILARGKLRSSPQGRCDTESANATKVANAAIARLQRDGAFPPRRIRAAPRSLGAWVPTPPVFAALPVEPFAGEWKLYSAESPSVFALPAPLAATTDAYFNATKEVVSVVGALTKDQIVAADAWHLDAGSVTPPGVWNLRLRQMLSKAGNNAQTAQLLAVLNLAMYDALVVCWHYKYTYWTERPVTATVRFNLGQFTPRLVTPPFPSYPSGHATVSGAAAEVIGALMPEFRNEALALAKEAAESRLWGGIHFKFDNDAGLELGKSVGDAVLRMMQSNSRRTR